MTSLPIQERIDNITAILSHRWRLIVIVTMALFLLLAIVVKMLPNTYQATTTILVYPQKVPEKYVASTVVEDPNDRLNMLQQEILSSTRLLEVIAKFDLYRDLVRTDGRDAAVELMRKAIKIQTKHTSGSGSSAFTLTFTGSDAQLAAQVANQLANTFIMRNIANREQQVQGTTDFLAGELDIARKELETQEAQLRNYRMRYLGEMPDQMPANLQALAQLQLQSQSISDRLARLEQERLLIENAPEADHQIRGASSPSAESALRSDIRQEQAKLADLLAHETQAHPDVIASQKKIAELKQQLANLPPDSVVSNETTHISQVKLQVLDKERHHLLQEQTSIQQRLNGYQARVDAVPLRQEELSSLTRDSETARDHYRSLLEKDYSAQMSSQLETKQDAERFEVLDPAKPPDHPSGPNRPVLLLASAVFALLGGFASAFSREKIDSSIKSEADLMKLLPHDIEMLGFVSNIRPVVSFNNRRLLDTN